MFTKTNNVYNFQYLLTGITGEGIKSVYLPDVPKDDKILFKKEQKWVRPQMPEHLRKEANRLRVFSDPSSKSYNPDYISPLAAKIREWEDQEWERADNGVWFWNNKTPTYLTGFHYWLLTSWECYFGFPDFRETDKEICYLLQFCEEDPDCFGLLLNTIRRYGKSTLMGGWAVYRTSRNRKHYCGMQGEKDDKIYKFYYQMVLQPFQRLPYYFKPTFNEATRQTTGIAFERTPKRGKKTIEEILAEEEDDSILESYLDYRPSGETEYDGSILHTYIGEEPGKVLACSIHERWKIVKPCLRKGRQIRGKCFMGTTVEFMDVTNKGGKAYQKLFYESDYDQKQKDGRTKSGMYAAFLPGDCAYEGFFDEWGRPMREAAREALMDEREAYKDSPKDLADIIRKYPLTIPEIFWVSADKCIFNTTILQRRKFELDSATIRPYSRYDLAWENNIPFTRIIFKHNPVNGWYKASWMFPGKAFEEMANKVRKNPDGTFSPLNEQVFTSGVDPVDHRVVIEDTMNSDDEFTANRRSRPVMRVKRRYDSAIDGVLTQEILEQRRDERYPYQTGISIGMMDVRPTDPNVYYERALMICWLHGMSLNVESAKPGIINYFISKGCADFIKNKYIAEAVSGRSGIEFGTPANATTINEYCDCLIWHIEYFGHCEPFVEFVNDYLIFNPAKTKQHDYTVASGWTELGEKIRPKTVKVPIVDLFEIMPGFDKFGNVVR